MKKTAKIISLAVSIAMVLSVVFTIAINVSAADTTAFEVVSEKSEGKVVLTVNLKAGGFNAIDAQFEMSEGVTCESIKQGETWKAFKSEQEDNGQPAVFTGNAANGKFGAATAATFDKTGDFVVATFNVDDESEFTITFKVDSCKLTEGEAENEVVPTIENATYSYVPEEPTSEEPTSEEPTSEEPTSEEPTSEEPTSEEPTSEEPTSEEPTSEEPTSEEPTSEEPTSEEPTSEEPTSEEPTSEEPVSDEPTSDEPTTTIIADDETTTVADDDETTTFVDDAAANVPATGTEKESPNTGTSGIVIGAIVTAISGAAVTLVLRRKNESED